MQNLDYQYYLMLHVRYFCSQTINNLLQQLNHGDLMNKKNENAFERTAYLGRPNQKRNLQDFPTISVKKKVPNLQETEYNLNIKTHGNCLNGNQIVNTKYFQSLVSSLFTADPTLGNSYLKANPYGDQNESLRYLCTYFEKFQNYSNYTKTNLENLSQQNFNFIDQFQAAFNNLNSYGQSSKPFNTENNFNKNFSNIEKILQTNNDLKIAKFNGGGSHGNLSFDTPNTNFAATKNSFTSNTDLFRLDRESVPISKSDKTLPFGTLHGTSSLIKSPNATQASILKQNVNEIINSQSVQNWCAICNTHFRLTSDLVYHMRTYHKKDEQVSSRLSKLSFEISKVVPSSLIKEVANKDLKYLKCEICHELFKEKHHLSRHMTSHR